MQKKGVGEHRSRKEKIQKRKGEGERVFKEKGNTFASFQRRDRLIKARGFVSQEENPPLENLEIKKMAWNVYPSTVCG